MHIAAEEQGAGIGDRLHVSVASYRTARPGGPDAVSSRVMEMIEQTGSWREDRRAQ